MLAPRFISYKKKEMLSNPQTTIYACQAQVDGFVFQVAVAGVQDEDVTVDFPSILPHHPAFLYQLAGFGNSLILLIQNIWSSCQHSPQNPNTLLRMLKLNSDLENFIAIFLL